MTKAEVMQRASRLLPHAGHTLRQDIIQARHMASGGDLAGATTILDAVELAIHPALAAGGGGLDFGENVGDSLSIQADGTAADAIKLYAPNGGLYLKTDDEWQVSLESGEGGILIRSTGSGGVLIVDNSSDGGGVYITSGETSDGVFIQQAPTRKLGFYGKAPTVQPAAPVTLNDVIAALKLLGLVAT